MTSRAQCIEALQSLSPTRLAESWDNVGLLVEPRSTDVSHIALTIDLTEAVCDEVLELGAELVVAYHPPIFSGLKRLTQASPLGRSLLRLVEAGVAVWSPHTALDAAMGGMNDWLASGVGPHKSMRPISQIDGEAVGVGLGRLVELREALPIEALVSQLKAHLGLSHLRLATPNKVGGLIERVALCPGAGGSLFSTMSDPADGGPQLFVTGEWGHHHVLAAVGSGASVILTDHTNTERGYLPSYAATIREALVGVKVSISTADHDPLRVC
ncbi:MAG: Nif3-like dinuclear metal center hexameric protein [Myxococcales bacterium]|nr:Nif3-like dinuclear metal center hexameric protein [Myxococcales bacterium]